MGIFLWCIAMPFNSPPQIEFAYDADGRQMFDGWRRQYRLTQPLVWRDPRGFLPNITVPAGETSDLASIPTWPLVLGAALITIGVNVLTTRFCSDVTESIVNMLLVVFVGFVIGYLRHDGPWAVAAFIHDVLYKTGQCSKAMADLIFYEILLETLVHRIVAWTFWLMLWAFGRFAYKSAMPLCSVLIALALASPAAAKPLYKRVWDQRYGVAKPQTVEERALGDRVAVAKCNVCHDGNDKKRRNEYGVALSREIRKPITAKRIEAEPETVQRELLEAFMRAESARGTHGYTYGDVIRAGYLPIGE